MRTVLCVFVGSVLLASAGLADDKATQKTERNKPTSDDMRRAIAFERAKDRADARQAAIEAKHPTVFYNQAERSAQDNPTGGNKVPDRGPGH
ncbi:MAG TPA: hypothetical protein VLW65_01490 [Bryobacteraceae bacterium]|nr:hypothetical protein [Bryobacteraceae bacterium]